MMEWLKKLLAWLAVLVSALPAPPAPVPAPVPPLPPPPDPDDPPKPAEAPSNTWVFKPVSDNDGKLAIVSPSRLELARVAVAWGPGMKHEESGRPTGRANGDRQHWRFTKPGRAYPEGLRIVVIGYDRESRNDVLGNVKMIPDPALRHEWH